jgi:hypothetical protein
MREEIIDVGNGFWNIRGSFRVAGFLNIGTQASLVHLQSGKFVFLDSYKLNKTLMRRVMKIIKHRSNVEAILNLHPFHTVHCQQMQEAFPDARLYGSARHKRIAPNLNWEDVLVNEPDFHQMFADDFGFSVPNGVDFISENESVHFSSVLAYHQSSKTIHVDDTLLYLKLPFKTRLFGVANRLSFHPTLSKALEKRSGAAADFQEWANTLAEEWVEAKNLCAAHNSALLTRDFKDQTLSSQITDALERVSNTLVEHEKKYG